MQIIKKIIFSLLLFYKCPLGAYLIVINPSQNNRTINNEYEKNITLLYAESLRNYICYSNDTFNVEITRIAGEKLEDLQPASFSNIINPNIHISLQCIETEEPEIFIFFNKWHNYENINNFSKKLTLISAFQSHAHQYNNSKNYAEKIYESLKKECLNAFLIHQPIGFPCKTLFGLISPAIAIEIGIPYKNDLLEYKKVIIETIAKCILTCSDL